jgi:hypothetical protein
MSTVVSLGERRARDNLRATGYVRRCLISINSLRKETETTVVVWFPAGNLPYPE